MSWKDIANELRSLPPKQKAESDRPVFEFVEQHYDDICAALERGYSFDEVSQRLQSGQVQIQASTLRGYVREIRTKRLKQERKDKRAKRLSPDGMVELKATNSALDPLRENTLSTSEPNLSSAVDNSQLLIGGSAERSPKVVQLIEKNKRPLPVEAVERSPVEPSLNNLDYYNSDAL